MTDYYDILRISRKASAVDIKRAFRTLAKRFHPDRNQHRQAWAGARTRMLLEAYAVLRDSARRGEYDEELRRSPEVARKRFWDRWEKRRRADKSPGSTAKLVFRFLLDGRAEEAVEIYEEMLGRVDGLDLRDHLEYRDYMDCVFLLAEEFERMGRLEIALELYQAVRLGANGRRRNGYLLDEVRHRSRNLLLKSLPREAGDLLAHKWLEKALEMDLSKSDRAFVFKKRAECYARTGNTDEGRRMIKRAFEIMPNLKGAKKICRIFGLTLSQ